MVDLAAIKASDGSGNASVATVQSSRSPGATTLSVDTTTGIPTTFFGTMGTPHTFTDPVTSETITVISEATAVDFYGHVDAGNLQIDTIAPGYTDAGSEVGDIIVIRPTTQYADNLADALAVAHANDGKLLAATPIEDANFAFTVEPITGWINDPNTFVYVSGTGTITAVFKVVGVDVTDHLQAGMPFVAVQGDVKKYGFITKVAFSTDTTITALMSATSGTVDNSGIANATITSFKFGLPKRPGFGFPLDPARWAITVTSANDRTTTSSSFGSLTDSITAPIGAWRAYLKIYGGILAAGSNLAHTGVASLSSSTSSESNQNLSLAMKAGFNATATNKEWVFTQSADDFINVTTPTTYTLIGKTTGNTLEILGSVEPTVLRLTCAYL